MIGATSTIAAVVVTHLLSQRAGEQRANHVRDELLARIASLEARITEVRTDFNGRITELRADDAAHTTQLRAEMGSVTSRVEARLDAIKEAFSLELRAVKAEILGALPQRVQRVGGTSVARDIENTEHEP